MDKKVRSKIGKRSMKTIECGTWKDIPENIGQNICIDISHLPVDKGVMMKNICVKKNKTLHLIAADNIIYSTITICLSGGNTLKLQSVHMKNSTEPSVVVCKGGNKIIPIGENIIEGTKDVPSIVFLEKAENIEITSEENIYGNIEIENGSYVDYLQTETGNVE